MIKKSKIYLLVMIAWFVCGIFSQVDAAFWDILNPKEIPAYPAFEKTQEQKLLLNGVMINIETYKGKDISIPQVVEYYKAVLAQRRWQLGGEQLIGGGGIAVDFRNEDGRVLQLILLSGDKFGKSGFTYMRIRHTGEGINKWISMSSELGTDMPGQDIPWLKRYPGSIRFSSMVDDKGGMNVSYILPNHNCLDCVVAFLKEEMAKRGWAVAFEKQNTKEDIIKEISSNDELDKLLEKAPDSLKEKLSMTGKSLSDIRESFKQTKQYSLDTAPEKTMTLLFIKENDMCNIVIALQGKIKEQYILGEERQEETAEYMEQFSKQNRFMYFSNILSKSNETIGINIMYMPSAKLQERQKPWF